MRTGGERKKRLLIGVLLFLLAGIGYAGLCFLVGKAVVPCLFHATTGLECPICGMTRMCLALLKLDFENAFKANPAVLILLAPGAVLALQLGKCYLREGIVCFTGRQRRALCAMCTILVLFGVWRNL